MIEVQNLQAIQRKERLRYSFLHELYYFSRFKAITEIRNDKVKNRTQEKTGNSIIFGQSKHTWHWLGKLEMDPEHELIAVIYKTKAKHQRNQNEGQTLETTTHNTRLGPKKTNQGTQYQLTSVTVL